MSRMWRYFMFISGPCIKSTWPVQNTSSLFSVPGHSKWHKTLLCSLPTFQICSTSLMLGYNKNTLFHYLMLCMSPPIANFCMKRHSNYYSKSEVGTCINWICKQELFTGFFAFRFYLMTRNKHILKATLLLLAGGHSMMVKLTVERYDMNLDSPWGIGFSSSGLLSHQTLMGIWYQPSQCTWPCYMGSPRR